jgi:hypothetical protein
MNAPLTLPRPSETAAEAYAAAFRGRDLASIRELQRLRVEVLNGDCRLIWIADCILGGAMGSEICGGDRTAWAKARRDLDTALRGAA